MEIGYKLYCDKDGNFDINEYQIMVHFCNDNNYEIIDHRPEYFEIAQSLGLTDEEKANKIRNIRSEYMKDILNKIQRYETQEKISIETTDSEETYKQYLFYLQYLRDIPQSKNFPNEEPDTFEEWLNNLN